MDLEATKTQIKIATTQFNRSITLNKEGLKPLTDVEEKRLKLQEVEAKIITQENKLLAKLHKQTLLQILEDLKFMTIDQLIFLLFTTTK